MLESADYPAVYRAAPLSRALSYAWALAPMAPAVVLLSNVLSGRIHDWSTIFFLGILAVVMLLCSGVIVLAASTYKLTLETDAISWSTVFAGQRMGRRDIAGYRRIAMPRGKNVLLFVPARPGVAALRVVDGMLLDARFDRWLHGLADLDQAEAAPAAV